MILPASPFQVTKERVLSLIKGIRRTTDHVVIDGEEGDHVSAVGDDDDNVGVNLIIVGDDDDTDASAYVDSCQGDINIHFAVVLFVFFCCFPIEQPTKRRA